MSGFKKATKTQARARIALSGPAGSGKTYTALAWATALGKSIAFIDTERGSASLYADVFDFDVLDPTKLIPEEVLPVRPVGRLVLDRKGNPIAVPPDQTPSIDAQGRVLVAGYALNGGTYDFAVTRYNANGTLDTSASI